MILLLRTINDALNAYPLEEDEGGSIVWRASAHIQLFEDDQSRPIGEAAWYVLLGAQAQSMRCNIIERADELDEDAYECAAAAYSKASRRRMSALGLDGYNTLLLSSVQIDPAYRGAGIGLHVIKAITLREHCDVVLLHPHPLRSRAATYEEVNRNVATGIKKLTKYYSRLGFERLGRSKYVYALGTNIITTPLPDVDLKGCRA